MAVQPRKISGPLFLPELEEMLAPLSRRQITYLVRQREKQLSEKIFLGGGKGCPLYLTLPVLSKYFPEFVDNRFELTNMLQEHLEDIDRSQSEMKKAIVSNRKTLNKLLGSNGSHTGANGARQRSTQARVASTSSVKAGGYKQG